MLKSKISLDFLEAVATGSGVSKAELEVVTFALDGQTTPEISEKLGISPVAVRKRLGEVYKKFNIQGSGPGKLATLQQVLVSQYRSHQVEITNSRQDWGEANNIGDFYGREAELAQLEQWIVEDRCRLVAVLGMGGIGKTSLSLKLAERIQGEFENVIWRSLRYAPPVTELLADMIRFLSNEQETHLPTAVESRISVLIKYLSTSRCLLILDNVETILQSDALTGHYRVGFEGYGELLTRVGLGRVGEVPHQSCLVLTSREKPQEIAVYEGEQLLVRSLQLTGLKEEAKEILRTKGLSGSDSDERKLVNRYVGNPLALKIVSTTIQELFEGNIASFLAQSTIVFGGIRNLLDQQFNRLSALEEKVMYWLAINREERVSLRELQGDMLPPMSQRELIEVLESLAKRSLIETVAGLFWLQPVVMQYVTDRLVEQVCEEITTQKIAIFSSHALIKAQAKDYIRDTQVRCILKIVNDRLLKNYTLGSKKGIEERLEQILAQLRGKSPVEIGYAGGNAINMLYQLQTDLTSYDFSRLTVWQAYLQGIDLHGVNFAHSNLAKSVFTDTFGSILSVAFSSNGQLLATGDATGEVRLWQVMDSEQLFTCKGHNGWVKSVAFSPDGQILASGGDDRTIRLWDTNTGQCRQILRGHSDRVRSVSFSPDGQLLASGSDDKTLRLWDARTGQVLNTFSGHSRSLLSVAFSPDGQLLASGSSDQTVKLWDASSGECLKTLLGHTRTIRSVAFSPDGQVLASGSSDQTLRIWDASTGQCLQTLLGHTRRVWSVAFSPDGQLASGSDDQTVRIWDINTGQCLQTLLGHTSRVWSVACNSGQIASGSDDQTVRLWNISTGKCIETLQGYTRSLRTVAFAPQRDANSLDIRIASGSDDRTVRLWDGRTGQCIKALQGHTSRVWSVAFSPDGQTLASGSDDQTVRLWDVSTGQCLKILPDHTNWVRSVAFSPDGQTLASSGDDQTVKLWDIRTGQCLQTLQGHTDWVWSVAFSPDGQTLASGSNDRTVKLWNVGNGQVQTLLGHTDWVRSVAFSPIRAALNESDTVASSSGDRTVRLWDVNTGQCLKTLSDMGRLRSVAFSPDGKILACVSEDKSVTLWDINTGECFKRLQGHTDWVRSVAFSPQGTILASGSKDETIKIWDIKTGECLRTLRAARPYEGMNIVGVTGLSEATIATLRALGAVENEVQSRKPG